MSCASSFSPFPLRPSWLRHYNPYTCPEKPGNSLLAIFLLSLLCPPLSGQARTRSPPKKPRCLLGTIQIPKVLRALHHSLSHLSFTRLISQPSIQDKVVHLTASKHTGSVLSLSSLSLHLECHSFSYPFLKLPLCLLKSYL